MASEFWDHYFGDNTADDSDLDEAIETAKPYIYPSRDELLEQLAHANASATRLRDTVYWASAHRYVNELLDTIVGR